ncbi:MAG TPA: hypothetical protein VKN99_15285 [Polyangia bacterium]|nr:hypothetical protein [Polyangia bacterium]
MRTGILLAFLASASAAGCGGSGANCSFMACGGSPVGDWRVAAACGTTTMGISGCSGASASAQFDSASGTVSFHADMTYQVNLTTSGSFYATIPGSCVPGLTSCDQLAQALHGNGISSVGCSGSASSTCSCSGKVSASAMEGGTWTVNGNQLTTQATGSSGSSTSTFCQQASSLKLQTSTGAILVLAK